MFTSLVRDDAPVYQKATIGTIDVLFQRSNVQRRLPYSNAKDFDISQITNSTPKRGLGVLFWKAAVKAAAKFGRGVYLSQSITESSMAFADKLVQLGLATRDPYNSFSYLST